MPAKAYGNKHQQERAALAPMVQRGEAFCCEIVCLLPNRWIEPGTAWDLAHNRATGGYLGPAHAHCNRVEGAKHRHDRAPKAPTSWSL